MDTVFLKPESSLLLFFFFMISQCFGRALGPSAPLKESPVAVGCDFL